MRLLLVCLLLLGCGPAFAQQRAPFLFTKDSVETQAPKWVLVDGDKQEYASPGFNDTGLPEVLTYELKATAADTMPSPFKGIAWLRLRFRVDTGLAGKPLAFELSQDGASELYLDGKKLYQRGRPGDAAHTVYYDPQHFPVPLVIADTLPHLLAIRYANWNYNSTNYLYHEEPPGFTFTLRGAEASIGRYVTRTDLAAIFCCSLFGMFLVLGILHFLFFLYYRQERSNLWFSLFAGSLAVCALMPYVGLTSAHPRFLLILSYYSFFFGVLACFALSGFLNRLFSRKPLRFRLMSALYGVGCLLYVFVPDAQRYMAFVLIISATLEAIVVIITAVIRKVPGARIIGAGLVLFSALLLTVAGISIAGTHVNFRLNEASGLAGLSALCIALLSIPASFSAYLAYNFAHVSRSLTQRLREVEVLSAKTAQQEAEKQRMLAQQNEVLEREVSERTKEVMQQKGELEAQHAALAKEKDKSDELLRNILPSEVAEELKNQGVSAARHYEEVSVLFTDFADFTGAAEQLSPQELVQELNDSFTAFDAIIEKHGLEKIKTIGDAYMAVCGLPLPDAQHAHKAVQAALEIRDFVHKQRGEKHLRRLRIGIHSGPVVAGIIGVKKFAYDIWGDTVNTAARMEQHGEADKVNVSGATYALVRDAFVCTPRGRVVAKHKGEVEMYFVETGGTEVAAKMAS